MLADDEPVLAITDGSDELSGAIAAEAREASDDVLRAVDGPHVEDAKQYRARI